MVLGSDRCISVYFQATAVTVQLMFNILFAGVISQIRQIFFLKNLSRWFGTTVTAFVMVRGVGQRAVIGGKIVC